MKVATLLTRLAEKSGVKLSEDEANEYIAQNKEFPEAEAQKITGLMSLDDAKQNFSLKSYFFSQALDVTDKEIIKAMDELGISIEDKAEVEAEKYTTKKIGILTGKIKNLESKKVGATSKEKSELQEQVNKLQAEIAKTVQDHKDNIKNINAEWQGKLTNSNLMSILSAKEYANKTIPKDVSVETAKVVLNKELAKVGAKIVLTDAGLALKQAKDESLDWYSPTNEKLSFEQFVDSTLATNKLLAVNDPDADKKDQGVNKQQQTVISTGMVNPFNRTPDFNSVLDAQLREAESFQR